MPVNYAEKYSGKVDERFKIGAATTPAVNNEYDFVDVNVVNVFGVETAAMGNYTLTGNNRYGTPAELGNSKQPLVLSRDRAFTFTIDKRSNMDTMGVMAAGTALARQLDEVVIPEIDIYRLAAMIAGAGGSAALAVTNANAYDVFLDAVNFLADNKVPLAGRLAYVTPHFYKCIKLDDSFIKAGDLAQDMLLKGQIGTIDGIPVIQLPTSYFPANTEFLVCNPIATVGPVKLADYIVHNNPPGINGDLVEGRVYYDAFVLDNKKNALYVHMSA